MLQDAESILDWFLVSKRSVVRSAEACNGKRQDRFYGVDGILKYVSGSVRHGLRRRKAEPLSAAGVLGKAGCGVAERRCAPLLIAFSRRALGDMRAGLAWTTLHSYLSADRGLG